MPLKRTIYLYAVVMFLVFCLNSYAYANMGTSLMLGTFLHLVFGNLVIGIIEGLVIIALFKIRSIKVVLLMIAANYFSMIIGGLGVSVLGNTYERFATIYNFFPILLVMITTSYLLTILLEWPFVFLIFRKQENKAKRSFWASAIVQTISYALLIPYYLSVSWTNPLQDIHIDKSLSFAPKKNIWIYYISEKDKCVFKVKPDGSENKKIRVNPIVNENAKLFLDLSEDNSYFDLLAGIDIDEKTNEIIVPHIARVFYSPEHDSIFSWITDLRPSSQRVWEIDATFLASLGFKAINKETNAQLHLAMETPFLTWPVRMTTILPNDQVVFQLGTQIIILDLNTRKIGLITKGYSPVVVKEE